MSDNRLAAVDQLARSYAIASIAHRGQVDKNGEPYIRHVRRVAERIPVERWVARCVAVLHDTIEDSDMTADDLFRAGLHRDIIDPVELLTRTNDVPSAVYYERIRTSPVALMVKLADLNDNLDPDRVAQLDEVTRGRVLDKYAAALEALTGERE